MYLWMTILKMRGSQHDKEIRKFTIDSKGMHIGKPFRNVAGIIVGNPNYVGTSEIDCVADMFKEDDTKKKVSNTGILKVY